MSQPVPNIVLVVSGTSYSGLPQIVPPFLASGTCCIDIRGMGAVSPLLHLVELLLLALRKVPRVGSILPIEKANCFI